VSVKATVTAGFDVRPGQMPDGVDHRHDDQPEDEADPDGAEGSFVAGVRHDRAASGEDQREGGERLGGGPPPQSDAVAHLR
jgi:hypothetical protein